MTLFTIFRTVSAAVVGAALLAQAAAAGGEPKNEWPFTRPIGTRAAQAATHPAAHESPAIGGERKNEPPFTRPATVVVTTTRGFSWTDGAIGGVAGVGVALTAGGLVLVARRSPRPA